VNRQHTLLYVLLIIIGLLAGNAAHANVSANVDRTTISIDDTFVLNLRIDKTSRSTLDLSALKQDFEILGTSQSSQFILKNGRNESFTQWRVDLAPQREGQLTIPPIEIDGQFTQPIKLNVTRSSLSNSDALPQAVYLETSLDKKSVYVQEQVVFTVRIFHAVQLDDLSLTPLEFDDTPIKQFEDTSFKRRINGMLYQVHERRYVLYPQKSGELVIPSLTFAARQITSQQRFGFRPTRGKPVRKNTEEKTISVSEAPIEFSGGFWLPASKISIEDNWSNNLSEVRVGDSITRTTTLRAEGLMFSQLPASSELRLNSAQIYPDQGETTNTETDKGITSQRIEKQAIIPTQPGKLVIPEQKVVWWNTITDQQATALLPERTIQVLPALFPDQPSSILTNPAQPAIPKPQPIVVVESNPFWMWSSIVLLLLWLLTSTLLWRAKNNNRQHADLNSRKQSSLAHNSERQAFKALRQQLVNADPTAIRRALLEWAAQFFKPEDVFCLNDVIRLSNSNELESYINEMNRATYGDVGNNEWNSQTLIEIIETIRKQQEKKQASSSLRGLYEGTE